MILISVSQLEIPTQELENCYSDECGQRWEYVDEIITKKDKTTQTFNNENKITNNTLKNNVSTQTSHWNVEDEKIKEANINFGRFVASELSIVPPIKRREIMWEIIRIFEHKST